MFPVSNPMIIPTTKAKPNIKAQVAHYEKAKAKAEAAYARALEYARTLETAQQTVPQPSAKGQNDGLIFDLEL